MTSCVTMNTQTQKWEIEDDKRINKWRYGCIPDFGNRLLTEHVRLVFPQF